MNLILKILRFAWKNKTWIIPAVTETYQYVSRWRKQRLIKKSGEQPDQIQNKNQY